MNVEKCRTCLEDKHSFVSIFNAEDSVYWSTQIMSIAKVNIYPNDGLPDKICEQCLKRLQNCLEFVEQCEKSDFKLRCLFRDREVKDNIKINESINDGVSNTCTNRIVIKTEPDIPSSCFINKNNKTVLKNEIDEMYINNKLKNEHKKIQIHQCSVCGKVLSTRFRLKTHLATHSEEKPFSCQYCEKRFTIVQNLKVHLRTHTGEKPLQCSVCGKQFAQSSGLAAHKRMHNGQTPYKCVLCPRGFRTIGHLQYHVRVHTGEKKFECGTCSRAFISRSDLKTHQLTHTGEKPHVCSFCGMRLSRVSNLRRHIRYLHKKDKLFSCLQCPLKFLFENELNRHKSKHKEIINDS